MENLVKKYPELGIYAGKKIFVTGHTGFKGTWLITCLHLLGAKIKGYALAPEDEKSIYPQTGADTFCESIIADIRDHERLHQEIAAFAPDIIFHLAAQPLVKYSYEFPTETFDVNAMGTLHVLDAVRKLTGACAVIAITTDKVYENKEWHYPYRETDRLGGYDPYSASKAAAEVIISSFRSSYFHPDAWEKHQKSVASARAGNVIGGGDWSKDRIIPDLVRSIEIGQPLAMRNPHAVRPWQHVLEPVFGYLLLGVKMVQQPQAFSEAWNFGPHINDNLTVESLVKMAISILGKGTYIDASTADQLHEAKLLKLDISKTMYEIGWHPKWEAAEAIRHTLEWYASDNPTETTLSQIEKYFAG